MHKCFFFTQCDCYCKKLLIDEAKRNQRNENETNEIENGRKNNKINQTYFHNYDAKLLTTHVSVSFIRRGQDLITIEQEYYAFIQRESVLFTWWLLLNLGTIRATSSLLKGEELK